MNGISSLIADTNTLIYLDAGNGEAAAIERNIPLLTADKSFANIEDLECILFEV